MSKIELLSLGGQDERFKSCHVLTIDNFSYIINAGASMPIHGDLGIKLILPEYEALVKNKYKIKGIFIGHPTYENFAGIPYLLQVVGLNTPIYTSQIGKVIIEHYLNKFAYLFKKQPPNVVALNNYQELLLSKLPIACFQISNSIPGSLGWIFKSESGSIIYLDDFIINNEPNKAFSSQINSINALTKSKNFLLIPSTGNVENRGYTTPNHECFDFYNKTIAKAKGRVIIALYSSEIYAINAIIKAAKINNRPIIIHNPSYFLIFNSLLKNKLINNKNLVTLFAKDANDSENAIVIVTGHRDQIYDYLTSIANSEIDSLKLKENDLFIFGINITPGYEGKIANLLDLYSKLDIDSVLLPKTILPLKASEEDQKVLLSILQPKYTIPVNGLYKSFYKYGKVFDSVCSNFQQLIFTNNGEKIVWKDDKLVKNQKPIQLTEKYIAATGSTDISNTILNERHQMSENGVLVIIIPLNWKEQKLLDNVIYRVYGSISARQENESTFGTFKQHLNKVLPKCIELDDDKKINLKETKNNIKKQAAKIFEKYYMKRPLILPNLIDISNQ